MSNKIVFIDIDGTLFDNENDVIHQSTLDALDKLKQNNIYVCIASGRSKIMSDEVFDRYHLKFDGYVMINGQYVLYNDEVIYKNPLEKEFIHKYIKDCDRLGEPYGFITADDTFVSSYDKRVVSAFRNFKMKLPRIMNRSDLNQEIYQGLCFDLTHLDYFSQNFKTYVKFIQWLGNGADIISTEASKAIGVAKLCERLNIEQKDVIAIGDSTNDIEMLQYAGISIAMGNAKPALKEVASYVTDDIEKDGLANALKKYHLI